MTYDGYGRLKTKHVPQQNSGTATTYSYNSDDTVSTSTDARGAVTTYSYNNRHLVTSVANTLSGSSTINVTYGYDGAGNRTSMSHTVAGVAKDSATYSYDQLSRLTSETLRINGLQSYGPNYGYYTISYGYTLSNQLTSVIDPFNSPTILTYDQIGRTASVTGSWNGTNYTYANNVSYRAWGGVKTATLGGQTETISYNGRMSPSHFQGPSMNIDYTYYNDGKLNTFKDLNDQIGDPHYVQFHYMSRSYSYDQAGRTSGVGQLPNYNVSPPFSGSYGYDAFDNLNSRSGQYALNPWRSDGPTTYTNDRRAGWSYNAEGQVISSSDTSDSGGSSTRTWTYGAAGELQIVSEVRNGQTTTNAMGYDGDGQLLNEVINGTSADYMVRSSVLGTVLTKLTMTGGKDTTYVPTNGLVAPMQTYNPYSSPQSFMSWVHRDPLGVQESSNGYLSAYDPLGNLVANVQPPLSGPPPYMPVYGATYGGLSWNSFTNANNFSQGCIVDGVPGSCRDLDWKIKNGLIDSLTISSPGLFNPGALGLIPVTKSGSINGDPFVKHGWNHIGDVGPEPQNPPVIFLTAQLLSNDKDPRVLCESKFEPTGFGTDTAALNVETDSGPAALSGDTFTVRANFLLPKYTKLFARSTGDSGSRVILGKDNRYRFPTEKEAPLGSSYAFFDDGDRRGHVDITLKLRDIEATKNSIFVTVAGVYESGELFSGQASLKIIGNNERPKTPCRPR